MVTGDEDRDIYLEHRKNGSGIRVRGHFIPFMKEGQKLDVIVCVPKGWNPLEQRRVIVPGSQTGQCDRCGQDIWIAPSTQELMKDYPDVPTRCLDCVKKQLEEKKMIKPKGAGTLLGIILVSVCGWVAIIGLVIKPGILVGSALSVVGGIAIGVAGAFLLRRWCGFLRGDRGAPRGNMRGITLVKVLIVLAILALWAAIVGPNLLREIGG